MSVTRYITLDGPRRLRQGETRIDDAAAGHAIVDIIHTGVCGSDVHGYTDGIMQPAIFGHEWVGTVAEVGEGVTRLSPGQRVIGGVGPACGRCEYCHAGHSRHCELVRAESIGMDQDAPSFGGYATRVHLPARRLVPVPDALTDVEAALVEPATVAFHAVRRVAADLGAFTVVQGAGPIGLATALNARAAGAGQILISEPSDARRAVARTLGFDTVVEPADLKTALRDLRGNLRADVVYECTGLAPLLQQSAKLLRRGGTLGLLGYPVADSTVSYGYWQDRELTVVGSVCYTRDDFDGAIQAIADGRLDVAPLHTGTFGPSELQSLFEELESGTGEHTKVLINPRA